MFIEFFYLLRNNGVAVSMHEWIALVEALSKGIAFESLSTFYRLCRMICVKDESLYDQYDRCFAHYFDGVELPAAIHDEVLKWLENPKLPIELTEEQRQRLNELDFDELRRQFEERVREQKERHDGGSKWVGTGGTSPFGHGGYHPAGIRVGGESRHKSAIQLATARAFRNLRKDVTIDTRSIGVALKRLRKLGRSGDMDELDIDQSISATAKNAGELELVFRSTRKNEAKLLLLLDVGGSMTVYTKICEQLFSAAHSINHFKQFHSFYFHNCVYDHLWRDMAMQETVGTLEELTKCDDSWYLMFVGDAAMSPYELTAPGGCIDYYHHNEEPGIVWLQKIVNKIPNVVWLNPDPPDYWGIASNQLIRRVVPDMFPLTVQGLESAIDHLLQR